MSSSLSGSLNRLPWSTTWISSALAHSRLCTNLWIDLHRSANLEYNHIPLALLGIEIKIEILSSGPKSMYIHISGWHTICFIALRSRAVTRWQRWYSGPRWCRSWLRCTFVFVPTAVLWILCCAIVPKRAAISLIFTNHYQVSFYCGLHLAMDMKYNTPLHLFLDISPRFFDLLLRFLSCCLRTLFFCHFGHIKCKGPVGLFKLYLTSLSCHTS